MAAQNEDSRVTVDCKVENQENRYFVAGTFQTRLVIDPNANELDQIEAEIKLIGQEFKRHLPRCVLENADA